jgi:FdhD protein
MISETDTVHILRFTATSGERLDDTVVRETPVTITLNNEELVTMLASPGYMDYLAVGFLFSEGLLQDPDEIKDVLVDENRGIVRVTTRDDREFNKDYLFKRMLTSGCGRGASFYRAADAADREKITSNTTISAQEVLSLMKTFQARSTLFKNTGGVHSAALCDSTGILVFHEDIGRHNALDKVFGECIRENIPAEGRIVVTSGRISSEILLKAAHRKIPILISKSAPTNLGIRLADEMGVTLLGFARGTRVNAYANEWRITDDGIRQ